MSKIDLNQQARDEMLKILEKMTTEREAGNCKEYKTLSDTFERFFSMDREYNFTKNKLFQSRSWVLEKEEVVSLLSQLHHKSKTFYIVTLDKLSIEIIGLIETIKQTLDSSDYKEHHAWSIAYERVAVIYQEIDNVVNYLDK